MNILKRLLFTIYSLLFAAVALIISFVIFNVIPVDAVYHYGSHFLNMDKNLLFVLGFAAIFFFIFSLWVLLSGSGRVRDTSGIKKSSQLGGITISLNCIESIVLSAIKQMDGVIDVRLSIENQNEKVAIAVYTVVTPEKNIPELSTVIQTRAKEVVERIIGTDVAVVDVIVEDIVQTIRTVQKARVE